MKIEITPNNGAIKSVTASRAGNDLLVVVNTHAKGCQFRHQVKGSYLHLNEVNGKVPVYQYFLIGLDTPKESGLVLIAEDTNEEFLLNSLSYSLCYSSQRKDQIDFLFHRLVCCEAEIAKWQEGLVTQ